MNEHIADAGGVEAPKSVPSEARSAEKDAGPAPAQDGTEVEALASLINCTCDGHYSQGQGDFCKRIRLDNAKRITDWLAQRDKDRDAAIAAKAAEQIAQIAQVADWLDTLIINTRVYNGSKSSVNVDAERVADLLRAAIARAAAQAGEQNASVLPPGSRDTDA